MSVNDETLRLQARRMVTLGGFTDDATRQLVRGWVRTWDQIAGDLTAALETAATTVQAGERLTWRQLNDIERFQAALARAGLALDDLAAAGRLTATNSVGDAVQVAREFDPRVIASQFPDGTRDAALALVSGRVSGPVLDRIVERTQQRIISQMLPLSAEAQAAMRRELVRGIVVGDNPRTAARRMLARIESAFNGGLTRAVRIARTEMLDAYRTANGHVAESNADVVDGWTWTATLDDSTCPACIAMHGTVFPTSQFGPEGHPNCRCDRVENVRPWSDLGFAGIEEPPSLLPDSRAWFDGLGADVQRRIMGPGRLEALQSGRIGWGDIASRRANDGWRHSHVVTPLKDLGVDLAAASA